MHSYTKVSGSRRGCCASGQHHKNKHNHRIHSGHGQHGRQTECNAIKLQSMQDTSLPEQLGIPKEDDTKEAAHTNHPSQRKTTRACYNRHMHGAHATSCLWLSCRHFLVTHTLDMTKGDLEPAEPSTPAASARPSPSCAPSTVRKLWPVGAGKQGFQSESLSSTLSRVSRASGMSHASSYACVARPASIRPRPHRFETRRRTTQINATPHTSHLP